MKIIFVQEFLEIIYTCKVSKSLMLFSKRQCQSSTKTFEWNSIGGHTAYLWEGQWTVGPYSSCWHIFQGRCSAPRQQVPPASFCFGCGGFTGCEGDKLNPLGRWHQRGGFECLKQQNVFLSFQVVWIIVQLKKKQQQTHNWWEILDW